MTKKPIIEIIQETLETHPVALLMSEAGYRMEVRQPLDSLGQIYMIAAVRIDTEPMTLPQHDGVEAMAVSETMRAVAILAQNALRSIVPIAQRVKAEQQAKIDRELLERASIAQAEAEK